MNASGQKKYGLENRERSDGFIVREFISDHTIDGEVKRSTSIVREELQYHIM
jgi:hypothetical protein